MKVVALDLPNGALSADGCLRILAWGVLAFLFIGFLPLFLCMPLWVDTVQYDIHAQNMLTGGIPYEHSSDSNLPGIQWIQTAVRAAIGWDSWSIRVVDFAIVALTVWMLMRWLPTSVDRTRRLWTAVGLFGCYLLSMEVVHCQRDVWMMPLVLSALALRQGASARVSHRGLLAMLEGMIWGLCIWIKPHALLMAVGVYVAWAALDWKQRCWRRWGVDAAGLALGGIAVGAAGLAWLWRTGAWNHFWEVLLVWSQDYVGAKQNFPYNPARFASWVTLFCPWSLIPLVAAPFAAAALFQRNEARLAPLFAVMYLLWFAQAFLLQVPHDYVLMPTLLIGLVVLVAMPRIATSVLVFGILLGLTLGHVGLFVRFTRIPFASAWHQAVTEGPTPQVRNSLAIALGTGRTDWVALDHVADYLRQQHVKDGELTCHHCGVHPLFLTLRIRPSIRHIQPNVATMYFPNHLETIRAELAASKHRFVVSDLQWQPAVPIEEINGITDLALPPSFPEADKAIFPWCEPIVYRSGPYVVHRITEPTRKFWH